MGRYRVCKSFTVESGHMLSKHPGSCRYPHGHTRVVEVVLSAEELDSNDMVVDFKAIKLLCREHIERYDHRMALNSNDPLLDAMQSVHPDSVLVFENMDPTTEVVAREIFDYVSNGLREGLDRDGYRIEPGRVLLERVRVTETPSSWAEYRV